VGKLETVEALRDDLSGEDSIYAAMAIYQICREMQWENCEAVSIEVLDDAQARDLIISMPAKDRVRIQVSLDNYEIRITDMQGKSVWSNGKAGPGVHDLPLSLFRIGIYAVHVKYRAGSITRRIAFY
jgi:hypothetical protein